MSTQAHVLYSPMEKKNIETLKETGIIPDYVGTWVHDHETALYRFGCGHEHFQWYPRDISDRSVTIQPTWFDCPEIKVG